MEKRYKELKRKSYRVGELSPGAIQTKWLTCGNPNCKCKRGEKHGPYYYLAYRDRKTGRTTTVYIPEEKVPELKERIENFKALKDDLWELVEIENEMRKGR
ncbi:hypothetical protein AKJ57_02575 [candidate division MSBL1 archaeon SCGC-AAA259A05]|uniref:DUF6788 domain-containing protein n=1 Tax=candidate division MSBL1 archaeon SCGC-AAA259A05 TaxID=1698259 RepID=A0A133UA49_9EURY|nr:hypothetical protein AKJ57_02575 [candidate division MSBL1 archaeon SCGC-AAA259A05]